MILAWVADRDLTESGLELKSSIRSAATSSKIPGPTRRKLDPLYKIRGLLEKVRRLAGLRI
jgi:hypothetical protein